jgi:hypothetical protein
MHPGGKAAGQINNGGHGMAGATGQFTNDGGMGCMLEHAYCGRAAGRFIKNGGRDEKN